MANFVQFYRSTDLNAPVLTGVAGALIALLDAILVNGYTTASISSIVEAGTTYTATLAVANNTLETGNHLTFAGVTGGGTVLNAIQAITVVNSTTVTFQGPGGLGTITGTITYRKAPLQWTKPFSGTNLAAYRPLAVTGYPQHYLRISDNALTAGGAKEAAALGYETMSDVNTGSGLYPTTAQMALSGTDTFGGVCWRKSGTADATARAWQVCGDGATFYFVANSDASLTLGHLLGGFGGFYSFKAGDAYNSLITGPGAFNTQSPGVNLGGLAGFGQLGVAAPTTSSGAYAARSYSQTGGSVRLGQTGPIHAYTSANCRVLGDASSGLVAYPHGPDGALWVQQLILLETTAFFRGRTRGIYAHCHNATFNMAAYDRATNVVGLSGSTLSLFNCNMNAIGAAFFDITGPWNG